MTDNEVLLYYNEMLEHYGTLPSVTQEPIRFEYYVKLYRYYKKENTNENSSLL